jgi:hypothetical protein
MMFYYAVYGTLADSGVEVVVRTFDNGMNITDQEAREAAMDCELIVRRDEKYTSCRVSRRSMFFK